VYVCRGWVARAIPQTAVCKHFCSPARPPPAVELQVDREPGLGEAGKGGVGKEARGGLLLGAKQQHRAEGAPVWLYPYPVAESGKRNLDGRGSGVGWAKGKIELFGEGDKRKA
jgi:hypothetical protein